MPCKLSFIKGTLFGWELFANILATRGQRLLRGARWVLNTRPSDSQPDAMTTVPQLFIGAFCTYANSRVNQTKAKIVY